MVEPARVSVEGFRIITLSIREKTTHLWEACLRGGDNTTSGDELVCGAVDVRDHQAGGGCACAHYGGHGDGGEPWGDLRLGFLDLVIFGSIWG